MAGRFARVALAALAVDLGPAVAVDVVDDEGRVPDAGLDGPAHVVPPEERAVGRVGVQRVRLGAPLPVALFLVRVGVEVGPLDDDVVPPVAVEVADAGLLEVLAVLHGDADVRLAGRGGARGHGGRAVALLAAGDERDGVRHLAGLGRGLVDEVGGLADGFGAGALEVAAGRAAVDVERHVRRIGGKQPPADVDRSVLVPHGHEAAVQVLRFLSGGADRAAGCHRGDGGEQGCCDGSA